MPSKIKIGTRGSELALWQAHHVSNALQALGAETEIIIINTVGDQVSTIPLYEFGVTGVFTKSLDIALLNEEVDIAVHSMKDVPTRLPKGIGEFAVLERGIPFDTLVYNGESNPLKGEAARTVATSSLRRQAQWLHHFRNDQVTGIRGNVNTRLQKLADSDWSGAIFAEVGLDRINKLPANSVRLEWMIPAAAQGALLVAGLDKNTELKALVAQINHAPTQTCVTLEREFMHSLEAGCTAPVGSYARLENNEITFTGVITALDGSQQVRLDKTIPASNVTAQAHQLAEEIKALGGQAILDEIQANK